LWTTASGSGQAALAQQKTIAASSTAAPAADEAFNAAGIGTGSRVIDGLWQFQVGDDLTWAQPGFDDSRWQRLTTDTSWADAGHPDYTGFAWYRRQITVDPAEKNSLALYLPELNSVAEVCWNGEKVGSAGTLPPHASWDFSPSPVVIPLPPAPGASTGTLAIRMWVVFDDGGFLRPVQIGYAPLIQQMRVRSADHSLRQMLILYGVWLIFLCAGLTALILWLRSRSQGVLLCAALYLVSYASENFSEWALGVDYQAVGDFFAVTDWINHAAFLFLILLLAGLPNRPGIRGFRFWKRTCICFSAIVLLDVVRRVTEIGLVDHYQSALSRFLRAIPDLREYAEGPSVLLLLVACLVLSKPRLPRLLFMAAAALDAFLGDLSGVFDNFPQFDRFLQWEAHPLFAIYGALVRVRTLADLLFLFAIIYAMWDQLSSLLAEQRRVNAELKAAQEVQTVLVAAEERGAPGYAVASVYRPASEVGGDFFQVIPLEGDATLIVAGDVSGKGLRAAMTVSLIVGAVRTLAEQDSSPAAVLAGLNRRLIGRTQGGFATCCATRIDPTGHAILANAGHCQPYLDGHEVELPAGLPLGLVDGITYEEIALAIAHTQQLTLVSDGVVEARNHHGELYGFDRLSALMRERPTAEHVAKTAVDFGQDDDITVLTVTRLAAEPGAVVQFSALSPAPA